MSALVQEDTVRQALVELEQVEQAIRDKRRACGMDFYVPNAMQLRAHQSAARTLIYCGGNRCVVGDTKIPDPVFGTERVIQEITSGFFVQAWDGQRYVMAEAYRPFQKGV